MMVGRFLPCLVFSLAVGITGAAADTALENASLCACRTTRAASTTSGASSASLERLRQRLADAERLRSEAESIRQQIDFISILALKEKETSSVGDLQPRLATVDGAMKNFDLEVESQSSVNPIPKSAESYQYLVQQYKNALSIYMSHREDVEKHVAAFHSQDDDNNKSQPPPLWPIEVPHFQPINVAVEAACTQMKMTEDELYRSALSCFNVLQSLVDNRRFANTSQYRSLWDSAEQQAISVQQQASTFNSQFLNKHKAISEFLHTKVLNAQRDGDFRESSDVYGQEQQINGLLHEELKRANAYSGLSMQLFGELNNLNPDKPQQPQQSAENTVPVSAGPISDAQLEQEYQLVQELYKKMQAAKP